LRRVHDPLASHLAANGYAWAASSFRSGGYRPDWFLEDTLQVRDLFIREVGRPRWTIIHGQSMGGHVAIASLELHPGVYQGAFLECGVIDGVGIADLYLAYKTAAEYFAGVPLLDGITQPNFNSRVSTLWLPALGEPGHYTERAAARQRGQVPFGGDLPPVFRVSASATSRTCSSGPTWAGRSGAPPARSASAITSIPAWA
jgi:pimeloyl-ACP methyl ester carboxylesterase